MTCKVLIGSKYEGPCLDRPCLRQMPRGWTLEESAPVKPRWWALARQIAGAGILVAYLVMIAQAIAHIR